MVTIYVIVLTLLVVGEGASKLHYPACCPFNIDICKSNSKQENKIFPGLFVSKDYLKQANKTVGTINSTQTFDNIPIDMNEREKRETSCNCCETKFVYSAPETIEYGGEILDVVQYDDIGSYQVITEGCCVNSQCSSSHRCQTMYKLIWILVHKECEWLPQMEFVLVSVPSHCECRNL